MAQMDFMGRTHVAPPSKTMRAGPNDPDRRVMAYLWARTILCPNCTGLIPLSQIGG